MRKAELASAAAFPRAFGHAPAEISRPSNDQHPMENQAPEMIPPTPTPDAMDYEVELERAGMFIPELGWERSLPTSPAHSHKARSLEFLVAYPHTFQGNSGVCVCNIGTHRMLTFLVHTYLCEYMHQIAI